MEIQGGGLSGWYGFLGMILLALVLGLAVLFLGYCALRLMLQDHYFEERH